MDLNIYIFKKWNILLIKFFKNSILINICLLIFKNLRPFLIAANSSWYINHYRSKLLKEVYRVSKINAKIVISVPGLKGYEYDDDHKKFYDKKILNDTLHKFGYKFVKDFYTPFKSELLNRNMRQYCMHGVYKKIND